MKQNKNKTMSGKRYKTKRKIAKHILRRLRRSATATTAAVQPQKVPSESEAVEISDDDLTDVCDHLLKLGFGLKRDKVADCLRQLGDSLNGFDVSKKAEICFQKFLFSDLNNCGSAVLPTIKFQVLKTTLDGPFILQVDEIVNVSSPGFERCLQLLMTDGAQRVYGFEFAPIEALDVCVAPCGLKVKISNVDVIHGRLALFPKNIEVLGGGLVYDLIPSHSGSTLHITDIVQATKGLAGNLWNREPNMGLIRYLLTRLKNEVISHAKTRKSNSDDFITEGCNEASGLVVCFGEMLIDCVPTVGWSIPKGYAFKKAPGGAPANVAVGISKLGGSSAFISKEVCGNRAKMCDLCNKYVRLRERYNHEFNCNGIQDNAGGSSR